MIFYLIFLSFCVSFDYVDPLNTRVRKVFLSQGETEITIPNNIEYFQSTKDYGPFYDYLTTIKSISFGAGSNLKEISQYCFYGCTSLIKIDMSSCIHAKQICTYAFYGCINLSDIDFPPNLVELHDYSFSNCNSLTEVHLPNSTVSIFLASFFVCQNLQTFYVTPNIVSIGRSGINNCLKLKEIIYEGVSSLKTWGPYALGQSIISKLLIPKSVTSIGFGLLEGCTHLKEIELDPSSNFVFEDCTLFSIDKTRIHFCLASKEGDVVVPNTVLYVSSHTFKLCRKVTSITFSNTVKIFEGSDHFAYCSGLLSITLPDCLTSISYNMFIGCSSIKSITAPPKVTSISSYGFNGCSSLIELHLPSGVTSFGDLAFAGTPSNINITFGDDSSSFKEGNHIFTKNYETVVAFLGSVEDIIVHSTTISINGNVYQYKKITSVDFSNAVSLISIGNSAFEGCTGLTTVILPAQIQNLGSKIFSQCTSIKSISLGKSLISIPDNFFSNSGSIDGITSIEIPNTVQFVHESAFYKSNIKEIVFEADSVIKQIGELAFSQMKLLEKIRQFPSCLEIVNISCFAGSSISSFPLPSNCLIDTIPRQCFQNCVNLCEVVISSSVALIGERAFDGCTNIARVFLGSNVEEISYLAFGSCSNLSTFTIPPGSLLSTVRGQAFFACTNLINFDVFGSEFEADGGLLYSKGRKNAVAYLSASMTQSVSIDSQTVQINKFTFQKAVNIKYISIPSSVRLIGFCAFDGCSGIINMSIGIESGADLVTIDFPPIGMLIVFLCVLCNYYLFGRLTLKFDYFLFNFRGFVWKNAEKT